MKCGVVISEAARAGGRKPQSSKNPEVVATAKSVASLGDLGIATRRLNLVSQHPADRQKVTQFFKELVFQVRKQMR